jgi:hypothetical protein
MWRVSSEEEELVRQLFETIRRTGVGKNVKMVISERVCPSDIVQVNLIGGEVRSFLKLTKLELDAAKIGDAGGRDIQLRFRKAMQDLEGRMKRQVTRGA